MKKTIYTADIGCYEWGRNVNLPKVKDLNEALALADRILIKTTFSKPIANPYVVQVYHKGKLVWDYMNGRLR